LSIKEDRISIIFPGATELPGQQEIAHHAGTATLFPKSYSLFSKREKKRTVSGEDQKGA
jgi:hypothetical protein